MRGERGAHIAIKFIQSHFQIIWVNVQLQNYVELGSNPPYICKPQLNIGNELNWEFAQPREVAKSNKTPYHARICVMKYFLKSYEHISISFSNTCRKFNEGNVLLTKISLMEEIRSFFLELGQLKKGRISNNHGSWAYPATMDLKNDCSLSTNCSLIYSRPLHTSFADTLGAPLRCL